MFFFVCFFLKHNFLAGLLARQALHSSALRAPGAMGFGREREEERTYAAKQRTCWQSHAVHRRCMLLRSVLRAADATGLGRERKKAGFALQSSALRGVATFCASQAHASNVGYMCASLKYKRLKEYLHGQ